MQLKYDSISLPRHRLNCLIQLRQIRHNKEVVFNPHNSLNLHYLYFKIVYKSLVSSHATVYYIFALSRTAFLCTVTPYSLTSEDVLTKPSCVDFQSWWLASLIIQDVTVIAKTVGTVFNSTQHNKLRISISTKGITSQKKKNYNIFRLFFNVWSMLSLLLLNIALTIVFFN